MALQSLVHPDVLELAALLRPTWPMLNAELRASGVPLNEGDPDPDPDPEPDPDPDPDPEPDPDPDPDDDPKDEIGKLRDELRKHRGTERRAKNAEKKQRDLEDKIKKLEEKDKSEQEKALEKAREDAKSEVSSEYEQKIRSSRLEVAVTRHASKGIEVEDGDEKKTVRFADPEDALLYIERALDRGDIDSGELFDEDGKVKTDALKSELVDLLESKPHYRAKESEGKPRKPKGGADAGKGSGPGGDNASVEAQLSRIKKHK